MYIRYARPEDKEDLKNIWQKCFSDSEKFVGWNFENNFSAENAMLLKEGDKTVSNLHLIPYDIVLDKKVLKGVYVSAVATIDEYRGKGYASRLIETALSELLKKEIDVAFLVPAIKGYYERFGFFEIAEKDTLVILPEISPKAEAPETFVPNAGEVLKVYLKANENKKLYLKRSLKDTALIINDLLDNTGGKIRMLADGSAYAMYKKDRNGIKVFELMAENEAAESKMLYFLYTLRDVIELELPPVMVKPLNKKLKAEDFLLPRESLYFNLIL